METRLLACENAATSTEIAAWANSLIGKEMPGDGGYKVVRIVHFQMIEGERGYDALVLVEISQNDHEAPINFKEADVAVIEELTSTIDDPA